MARTDYANLAARAFDTPLMLAPAKAAVIAGALGPRLVGVDAAPTIVGFDGQVTEAHERGRPQAASLLGDEVHQVIKRRGTGYSVVGGVAVIPVVGSLVRRGSFIGAESGSTSYEGLSAQIRAAAQDDGVRAIALEIDSFGGEAAGIFDLAQVIRDAREVKPVHAFVADYALSAGYAIASQADTITVPPYGEVGSIGVVSMHVDHSKALENEGLRVTLVHSGLKKIEGNPFEPLPSGVRDDMQAGNDAMRVDFAELVEKGRRGKISMADAIATEAGVFSGAKAVEMGLADNVAEARVAFGTLVSLMNPEAPVGFDVQAISGANTAAHNMAALLKDGKIFGPAEMSAGSIERGPGHKTGALAPNSMEGHMKDHLNKPGADAQSDNDASGRVSGADAVVIPTAADERERIQKIRAKIAAVGLPQAVASKLEGDLIDNGTSYADAMEAILDAKTASANDGGDIRNTSGAAVVTHDAHDKLCEGMTKALLGKAGLDGGERNEFTGMQLREMARTVLVSQGGRVPAGGAMQMAGAAFAPATAGAMHSTSDFGNILVNVANKSMLKGFDEAPETFERFTSVGTLSDFKPHQRVGLDSFPSLREVREGAEFKYISIGDHAESAILATYGELFAITRQTVINDDLAAFTTIPMKMGRAARRTVGDLVFAVLTGNPDMSDGTALFHEDHKNLAASGAGPSEATINAAITAMAEQTDRAGNARLNISPAFLLAPPKWRSAVLQSLNSEYAPDDTDKAGSAKQPRAYNTVRDAADPIFDSRISGDSWFMLADPAMYDTIEVGYLDGIDTPFLDDQDGWTVDGTEFKVRIDAAATPLAYQGLYKNAGS